MSALSYIPGLCRGGIGAPAVYPREQRSSSRTSLQKETGARLHHLSETQSGPIHAQGPCSPGYRSDAGEGRNTEYKPSRRSINYHGRRSMRVGRQWIQYG
jgi:hypothetical protein